MNTLIIISSILAVVTTATFGCKKEPTKLDEIKIKSVEASSFLESGKNKDYAPENLIDGSVRSWCEGKDGDGDGETVKIVFDKKVVIGGFFIRNGFGDESFFKMNGRIRDYEAKTSDGTVIKSYLRDNNEVQEVKFEKLVETGDLLIKIGSAYSGSKWKDTCITEISFDRKKIDTILSIADACRKEGKFYEFGACIPSASPIAAALKNMKSSSVFTYKTELTSLPDYCRYYIHIDNETGAFRCGFMASQVSVSPGINGRCKKLNPNEIECTADKFSEGPGFYPIVMRIKKHEVYDDMLEIHEGPYSSWLKGF